jgi:hypothetical protein
MAALIWVTMMELAGPATTLLQAEVAHCAHEADGIPPEIPAFVQLAAREGERMPDQSCPKLGAEEQSKIRGNKNQALRFIITSVTPDRKVSDNN